MPNENEQMTNDGNMEVGELRKRKNTAISTPKEDFNIQNKDLKIDTKKNNAQSAEIELQSGTFWLTRICLLRSVAFVYFIAFLVALRQNKELVGRQGLLPTPLYLDKIKNYVGGEINQKALTFAPTLLWFVDLDDIDVWLDVTAWVGLILSGTVLILGAANMILMFCLWVLYHSLVNIGQRWYSFGWESQLLETGFLAIFLCPLLTIQQFPQKTPPPWVSLWGYRWLIFRIMIGAGLIKIRGDDCWRDLTCMHFHYETQPVPSPVSFYLHQSPEWFHKFEVLSNHFIELVAAFFVLIPIRPIMWLGGFIQILFQVVLIISGNLSFLNWLTIIPSIACFDDKALSVFFPCSISKAKQTVHDIQCKDRLGTFPQPTQGTYIRYVMHIFLALLLAYLSSPVVMNLFSQRQVMNTSFDPLRIVNTYGAFGSVTKERSEVILQGTYSIDPNAPSAEWLEYEFKCKPGDVYRRPCLITPYHYRLDWLMWFAAFQNYQSNDWLIHLVGKLLMNDNVTSTLIAKNPFLDKEPPRYIRAEHYRYKYSKIGSKEAKRGQWWIRWRIGQYMPPVSLNHLYGYMVQHGWSVPKDAKKKMRAEQRTSARAKHKTN